MGTALTPHIQYIMFYIRTYIIRNVAFIRLFPRKYVRQSSFIHKKNPSEINNIFYLSKTLYATNYAT